MSHADLVPVPAKSQWLCPCCFCGSWLTGACSSLFSSVLAALESILRRSDPFSVHPVSLCSWSSSGTSRFAMKLLASLSVHSSVGSGPTDPWPSGTEEVTRHIKTMESGKWVIQEGWAEYSEAELVIKADCLHGGIDWSPALGRTSKIMSTGFLNLRPKKPQFAN